MTKETQNPLPQLKQPVSPNSQSNSEANPTNLPAKKSTPASLNDEYVELKKLVRQRGLLDKQPGYATIMIIVVLSLFAISVTLLFITNNPWLLLLNAVLLAFAFTQVGFIAHDVGHRQAFYAAWKNDIIGYTAGNLLLGMSYSWWMDKHNRHHSLPNVIDHDPDIEIPVLAFSEEQALSKPGIFKPIIKYQAYFFFPMLLLGAYSIRGASIKFLLAKKAKHPVLEVALIATHLVLYLGLLFYILGFWPGLLFIVIHQALFGLYNTSVFAPNHKGMPLFEEDNDLDFLRLQVLTARNVKAGPITDFWYGGLNYQIEHHLFPNMPRNKLGEAQQIVRDFCQERSIDYYETGMVQSYREILQYFHKVSAPLRAEKKMA